MLLMALAFTNPAEPGLHYFPSFYFLIPEVHAYGVNNWLSLDLYNRYINANLNDDDKANLLAQVDGNGYFLWGFGSGEILLNYRGIYGGIGLVSGSYFSTLTKDPLKLLLYGNDGESIYDLSIKNFEHAGYFNVFLGAAPRYNDFIFGLKLAYVNMTPYLKLDRGFVRFEDRASQYPDNTWIVDDTIKLTFFPGGTGFTSSFGFLYEPMGKGWFAGFSLENIFSSITLKNQTTFPGMGDAIPYDTLKLLNGYWSDNDSEFVVTDTTYLYITPEHAFELMLAGRLDINALRAALKNGDTLLTTSSDVRYLVSRSYALPRILRVDFGYRDVADKYAFRFQYIQGFNETFYSTRTPKFIASAMYRVLYFLPVGANIGLGGREKFEFGLYGGLDFRYWFLNLNWNWSRGLFSGAKGHRLIASMGFKSPLTGKFQVKVIDSLTGEPLIAGIKIERGDRLVASMNTDSTGVAYRHLSPDRYSYTVEKAGYVSFTDTITIIPKYLNTRLVKLMPAGGFIDVVVIDSITGDTLKGAKVVLNDSSHVYAGGVLRLFASAGKARIAVYKDGYADYAEQLDVEVGKVYPKTILLAPSRATLVVRVKDSKTGKPLSAHLKVLSAEEEVLFDTVASDARVVLPEAGAYRLMVQKKGYYDYSEVIPVKRGMTVEKEVSLRKVEPESGTLIVKVIDALTQEPVAGANIVAVSSKGDTVLSLTTGRNGTVKSRILKGKYSLIVSAQDYLTASRTFSISKNQTVDITVPLKSKYGIVYGYVLDNEKGTRVRASIRIFDESGKLIQEMVTDSYMVKLPAGTYKFEVSADKYIKRVADISLEPSEKFRKDFLLLKKKEVLTFRNIYFDFNKATIRPESYPVLDSIAMLLKENPSIIVEVAGHTDERGSEAYNLRLSQARAEAVVNYLIKKGIDPRRLIPKGYGESQPIIRNAKTEAEHQLNRRVEFRIIGELPQN